MTKTELAAAIQMQKLAAANYKYAASLMAGFMNIAPEYRGIQAHNIASLQRTAQHNARVARAFMGMDPRT